MFYSTHAAAYARHRRRGESNFRIEIFANVRDGQKGELGGLLPELALTTAPYIREYFYTKTRFSTPTICASSGLAGQIYLSQYIILNSTAAAGRKSKSAKSAFFALPKSDVTPKSALLFFLLFPKIEGI
jgi:hypothetical protein